MINILSVSIGKKIVFLTLFALNNSTSGMVKQGSKRKPAHDAMN
jgi:hypothetical protein